MMTIIIASIDRYFREGGGEREKRGGHHYDTRVATRDDVLSINPPGVIERFSEGK
jgi:hypothetical protein